MAESNTHPNLKLFSLNSNRHLAEEISKAVGVPLSKATVEKFSDDEIKISVDESIRGDEVYIVQSVSDPVNSNLMELLIMVDAVRRASAKSINVVIPYYGYSRADRKARSREPITAKLVASFLKWTALTVWLHLICTPIRFRGSSTFPLTILRRTRCWPIILLPSTIVQTSWWFLLIIRVFPEHGSLLNCSVPRLQLSITAHLRIQQRFLNR